MLASAVVEGNTLSIQELPGHFHSIDTSEGRERRRFRTVEEKRRITHFGQFAQETKILLISSHHALEQAAHLARLCGDRNLFPKSEIGKQLVPTIKLLHPEDSHAHIIQIGHPHEAYNLVLTGTSKTVKHAVGDAEGVWPLTASGRNPRLLRALQERGVHPLGSNQLERAVRLGTSNHGTRVVANELTCSTLDGARQWCGGGGVGGGEC